MDGNLLASSGTPEETHRIESTLVYDAIRKRGLVWEVRQDDEGEVALVILPLLLTRQPNGEEPTLSEAVGALAYLAVPSYKALLTTGLIWDLVTTRLLGFAVILVVLVVVIARLTARLILDPLRSARHGVADHR